jgi:hypothetical protein
MSDGAPLTLETLRVEGSNPEKFACIRCGVPKERDQFEGESIACLRCAPLMLASRRVDDETLRKTKFDLTLEELQESQSPAIPGGVQRAHQILGGKTSSELIAEVILEIKTGKTVDGEASFLPRDGKLLTRAIETFQRSEIKHDEFLRSQPPAAGISYEEAKAISIDTFIMEMVHDKTLRKKVMGILYERCPDLINELMEVAGVTVVNPSPVSSESYPDLENGGVI